MRWWALLPLLALATPAVAQDRDFCADRPGLGTPACIVDKGRVMVETALADWTRDDQPETREDTLLIADTLVRVGVSDRVELQVGWTPFGHDYLRDRATGTIDLADRVGDVLLGAKVGLINPAGDKFSVALLPSVTLPVGRRPIGAGDWAAGIIAPVNYDLSDAVSLQLSPEVDAAVDGDGYGRHLAYGSVVGLGLKLSKAVSASLEYQAMRDDDPTDSTTQSVAAFAFAWQAGKDFQLDVGSAAGLNRDTPDLRLYAGIARRF